MKMSEILKSKIIRREKSEFKKIPESLEGRILLEEHIENGKIKGWFTIDPEDLDEIFDPILQSGVPPNKKLSEFLIEKDDILEEIDPNDLDGSAKQISKKRGGDKEFERRILRKLKNMNLSSHEFLTTSEGKIKVPLFELGYKKYIRKWKDEGLIE